MTDEKRALSPRPFRPLDRANPLPSPEESGITHAEKELSREARQQVHHQKLIGATAANGAQVYGKVQEYVVDQMVDTVNHHFDAVAQIEQSGDERKAKALEEFAYPMLDDAKFNYRQIAETAGDAINQRVREVGNYKPTPRKGIIKRILE